MVDKLSTKFLALILILTIVQAMGSSFTYDFPQIFEAVLIEKLGINAYKVQLLYSIGTAPNLVSNLIASFFLPKLGVGYILIIFQLVTFSGAALAYLALRIDSYTFLCIARVLVGISFDFGILGGILSCEKWFRGKILSISLGLARLMRLVGSSVSFYLLPKLFISSRNIETSAFFCVIVCFATFCTTSILAVLDIKYEHLLKESEKELEVEEEDKEEEEEFNRSGLQHLQGSKIVSVTSVIKQKEFRFRHFRYISPKARFFLLYVFLVPSMYYQMTSTGSDFLVNRFRMPFKQAKNTLSILPLICGSVMVPCSFFYTKFGNKSIGILLASLFALASYATFAVLPVGSGSLTLIPIILLGFYYGLNYSTMFSSLILSVPKEASSTIVGISITCQNMLYASLPLLTGYIYRNRTIGGYQNWLYFMIFYSLLATLFALMVLVIDLRGDRMLMIPENDPRVLKIQKKMSSDFQNSVLRQSGRASSKGPNTEYATLGVGTAKSWRADVRSPTDTNLNQLNQGLYDAEETQQKERADLLQNRGANPPETQNQEETKESTVKNIEVPEVP